MARKKRDTSKKRESILDAAIKAFVQDGYDNTSMDRIAETASASKRTVYNHFSSKEELFQAVLQRFLEESESLKAIPYDSKRSLEDQLSDFVNAKLAILENQAWLGLVRVTLSMLFRDTKLARESLEWYEAGDEHFLLWLQAARDDGQLHIPDVNLSATMFLSTVGGVLSWPQLFAGPMEPDKAETLKKEIIDTFLQRHLPNSS